jgi:hypothetical protein
MGLMQKLTGLAVLGLVAWNLLGCGGGAALEDTNHYKMSGSIQNAEGKGLPYSSVILAGAPRGSLADRNGDFSLGGILPGRYDLTVLYLGYRSRVHPVRTSDTEERSVTLDMVRDPDLGPAGVDSLGPVTLTYQMTSSP